MRSASECLRSMATARKRTASLSCAAALAETATRQIQAYRRALLQLREERRTHLKRFPELVATLRFLRIATFPGPAKTLYAPTDFRGDFENG